MIDDDWLSAAGAAAYATALASKWGRARLSVRTLLELARKGKIDCRSAALPPVGRSRPGRPPHTGRKLWFRRGSLYWLIMRKQLVFDCRTEPSHFFISDTLSSKKIASSRYSPGEVITKAEAARILGCSIRGVEYLTGLGQLKAIRLGHRLVVFSCKKVLALKSVRATCRSGKRKVRLPHGRLADRLVATRLLT